MVRHHRWQVLALVIAVLLFAASLTTRLSGNPETLPSTQSNAQVSLTITPFNTPALDIAPTPVEAQNPASSILTFREALVGEVHRLNPLLAGTNPVDADVTSLIFEGLTRTDQYGEIVPALARDWLISSDGLEYVVRLREDILWQDGIRFNAADVLYTMSLLSAPDFPGSSQLGAFWRTVEVEQLGEFTVRFRLTQPLGNFTDMLRIGILPVHALQGTMAAQLANHPFNLSPIGTGPYQLEALRSSGGQGIESIDLRVAPVYRQRPEGQSGYALERLSFHLFPTFDAALQATQQGEVDALVARQRNERHLLVSASSLIPLTALEPTLGVLIFNWVKDDTRFFRELRVRQALEVGLDRSLLVDHNEFLSNTAVKADSPLLPGSWAYVADLPWPFYPTPDERSAAALQLLTTARIPQAESTEEAEATPEPTSTFLFSFTILTPSDPALERLAQQIAVQWSQYNLNVRVEAVDLTTYQQRLESGDFDAALIELSLGDSADPDVYAFWHQGQYPDGNNYGGVDDREISELLERARRDPSGINRATHYAQFQREFVERAIALPLYYALFTYAIAPHVEGVQLGFIGTPSDRFRTIHDWTISRSD